MRNLLIQNIFCSYRNLDLVQPKIMLQTERETFIYIYDRRMDKKVSKTFGKGKE